MFNNVERDPNKIVPKIYLKNLLTDGWLVRMLWLRGGV